MVDRLSSALKYGLWREFWDNHRKNYQTEQIWRAILASFINTHFEQSGIDVNDQNAVGKTVIKGKLPSGQRFSCWLNIESLAGSLFDDDQTEISADFARIGEMPVLALGIDFHGNDENSPRIKNFKGPWEDFSAVTGISIAIRTVDVHVR